MSAPAGAVFLSYASEDAEAAAHICRALRAAGVEVWFDQSELRGGDAWDRQIRGHIHDCRLFIAVISANTEARDEGYFRREWRLAVDRTHDMSESKAFLIPVVIDGTSERGATVPDKFREVQWTRLPGGETPGEFVTRVAKLLAPEPPAVAGEVRPASPVAAVPPARPIAGRFSRMRALPLAVTALAVAALGYLLIDKLGKRAAPSSVEAMASPAGAPTAAAPFTPPAHSIAVLPFVNLSGDAGQEYFSDGLTEELLNSLAAVEGLQVAARTSSFSFKGKDTDIGTIAHRLNVSTVLEGSVRRSSHTVRITAQLINAVTGYHLWSKTFDRDLGDVLKLQTEIATAVAGSLKVTLLGDIAAKIELGGTRNPDALDAYLRASKAIIYFHDGKDVQNAIGAYSEAIRLDPGYALAFAGRSLASTTYAGQFSAGTALRETYDKAQADARRAITLAPELAEGHLALAYAFETGSLDFTHASESYERALALAPGDAVVLDRYARFSIHMGRTDAAITAARHAAALDPLNPLIARHLGQVLMFARRYDESRAALNQALALDPDSPTDRALIGIAYYSIGDLKNAQAACELTRAHPWGQMCLAVVYHKVGRQAEAEALLASYQAEQGDIAAYQYAAVYSEWGDVPKALAWLDRAMRLRDPGLEYLTTDPFMDPLRKEPRFQAAVRELKFPDAESGSSSAQK